MIEVFQFQQVLTGVIKEPNFDLIEACLTKKAFMNIADFCVIYDAVIKAGFDNTYAPVHVYGGITVEVDNIVKPGNVIMATPEDFKLYKMFLSDPWIQNKEQLTFDDYNRFISGWKSMGSKLMNH